jgi:MFS family permease
VRIEAPALLVGLIAALPSLGAVLLSLPASRWAEGWRDPVRVVVVSRFWMRLAYLPIAVVPGLVGGLPAALLVTLFWGLSSLPAAITMLAWTMVIADLISPSRRPMINGIRWALFSIITAVAGAGFGLLLEWLPFPINYQAVFGLSFLAGMVTVYTFSRVRQPPRPSEPVAGRSETPGLAGLARLVRQERPFARFLLTASLYRIGLYLPVALFPIYWVTVMEASDILIGLRTTAGYAALVVSYVAWGYVAVRLGHRLVLLVATAGLALYPIATALTADAAWLIPIAVLWGAFASGLDIAFFEVLLRTLPVKQRASFVAVDSTLANLVAFAAPLLGAALTGVILSGLVSLAATGLMLLLAVARDEPATTRRRSDTAA